MLGAIIGDIAGSRFEFNPTNRYHFELFTNESDFTDDTICTVAVADAIMNERDFNECVHEWCRRYPYPMGGYGGSFARWVHSDHPMPYNSFGNGSAMRVSPVAWFADSREKALELAAKTAAITHNHPEGIKGAQTVALAIYDARQGMDVKTILDDCVKFSGYNIDLLLDDVQNKFNETCQGTVPVGLWIIGQSRNFEDAIRRAVSLGADADTLGAIVGSIAEAIWGIPEEMEHEAVGYLPKEMKEVVTRFYEAIEEGGSYMRRDNIDDIVLFADKYIYYFENKFEQTGEDYYRFFDSEEFPNDCKALGFEMDCGHSFTEAYGECWNTIDGLKANINRINNIFIIGNGLFSQWRYFNHWSYSHADENDREWFLILFRRLKELCKPSNENG